VPWCSPATGMADALLLPRIAEPIGCASQDLSTHGARCIQHARSLPVLLAQTPLYITTVARYAPHQAAALYRFVRSLLCADPAGRKVALTNQKVH
jgi:hypothetical protein